MNYKIGDKIIINKDMELYGVEHNRHELFKRSEFNGMIATIDFIFKSFIQVDINGKKANFNPAKFNPEVIERKYKKDYREDLLNIADDIDGVLLKNINPPTELIQKNIKKGI